MPRESTDSVTAKIQNSEYKLIRREGLSSDVWKKFLLVVTANGQQTGYVSCETCNALLTYASGTTHLKHHVCKFNAAASRLALPSTTKQTITSACVLMCAKDLRPFNTVAGEGFKELGQELINIGANFGKIGIADVLPHPSTISRHIHGKADEIRNVVVPQIISSMHDKSCAATVDMWTDQYNQIHYLTLTTQRIDREWKLFSNVLFTTKFPDTKKTSENIIDEVYERMSELNIPQSDYKEMCFVTDQGANIKKAFVHHRRLPCAAHCINTVLAHVFDQNRCIAEDAPITANTINAAKVVVRYLKKSGLAAQLKTAVQQEVITRWNSLCTMLQSVCKQYDSIVGLLKNHNALQKLDGFNYERAEQLVAFLTPFKEATDDLEHETEPTIHLVLLWFHKLQQHCSVSESDCEEFRAIKIRAQTLLSEKLLVSTEHKIATFLWPPFRHLKMIGDDERKAVLEDVRRICGTYDITGTSRRTVHASTSLQEPPKKKKTKFSEWVDDSSAGGDEVGTYSSMNTGDDDDVLGWWKEHETCLPTLSVLARRTLCIPATSANSERNFSKAGILLTSRRSQLDPEQVNDLLLIHSNYNNK